MRNISLKQYPFAACNSDPENWKWDSEDQQHWSLASEEFQTFNTHYRNMSQDDWTTGGIFCVPFAPPEMKKILIRDSYLTTFDGLWHQTCTFDTTSPIGYLITGQPGIGKSLFLYYILVRLLQLKQPVLFSDDGVVLQLFLHDHVYVASEPKRYGQLLALPVPLSDAGFVWSLFDMKALEEPSGIFYRGSVCPIQVASPNPLRFRRWRQQRLSMDLRLPLWNETELRRALPIQPFWPKLREALEARVLDPKAMVDLKIALALDQLQPRPAVSGEDSHVTLAELVEDQISELLRIMMDQFGCAARDVFSAIESYASVSQDHKKALQSAQPGKLVSHFDQMASLELRADDAHTSYQLFAVSPVGRPFDVPRLINGELPSNFEVNFKSERITLSMVTQLRQYEQAEVRRLAIILRCIPAAPTLAAAFFEALAHCTLRAPSSTGHRILYEMTTIEQSFRLDIGAALPSEVSYLKAKRPLITFPSSTQLPVAFMHQHYYLPSFPNLPLVDAFTVDIDAANHTCVLWLLRVTVINKLRGPKEGCAIIQEIVKSLKTTHPGKAVIVRYILVVPERSKQLDWQFPEDWPSDVKGKVYCLKLAL